MNIIWRVNMANQTVKKEEAPESYALLGGRALIGKIMLDEVDPLCHPLGPNNKLIIATGLLSGTTAPSSGRISIGAKSPLTYGIKESNAGGPTGHSLAKMGVKAVIIEGMPRTSEDEFFILRITPGSVEILQAPQEIIGKGCYYSAKFCKEHYTKSHTSSVLTIGQAGEMRAAAACISLTNMEGDTSRQAGRGGMGAVMGSKKIKAIIVDSCGKNNVVYSDPGHFQKVAKELAQQLATGTTVLSNYGTANLVTPINNVSALPVKNFSFGTWKKYEKITGQEIRRLADQRGGRCGHACLPGCCIRCSNIIKDEAGKYITSSLEYETIGLIGSNCLIDDLDCIARCDYRCDDYGVDSIDTGSACAVAMEAGFIGWGDQKGLEDLLDEIGKKTAVGRLIASGANIVGRVFGQWRVPQCKGQAIAAYDPRGCKGTGVTYATSPMGGDHTAGNALPGRGGIDTKSTEKQASLSRNIQVYTAYMLDSVGFCLFVGPSYAKAPLVAEMLNSRYNLNLTAEDIYRLGIEVLKREIAFNKAAGIADVDIPEFLRVEQLSPNQQVFDVSIEDIKKVNDFDYIFPEEKSAIF